MNDIETVQKLAQHGFNGKEIRFITTRAAKEKTNCSEIINQINRVFIALSSIIFLLLLIGIWEFFNSELQDFYAYGAAVVTVIILACLFAPMKLGAKIFFYLRKKDAG